MTTYPDPVVLPVSQKLLSCLSMEALQNPKPPSLVGFRTGTSGQVLAGLDVDECCEGAAFVRAVRTYASWGNLVPVETAIRCAQPFAVEFELSMWRCTPIGTGQAPPGQGAWDELNTDLLNDRRTLQAAACCFFKTRENGSVRIGEWRPIDVEGGCVGGILPVGVDLFGKAVA